MKLLRGCCIALVFCAAPATAQTPASGPTFEVASIRPSAALTSLSPADLQSGKIRIGMNVLGSRVEFGFMSLPDLIRIAYDVKAYQISGPDWMATQRFDITATLPEGATRDQVNGMLRALLAERFKLTEHREQKERPIYALVVGKDGSKLKPSAPDVEVPKAADADTTPKQPAPGEIVLNGQTVTQTKDGRGATVTGGPTGPVKVSIGPAGEHVEASKITLPAFADVLSSMVDRPVVDMTGLAGTYQLTIDIPMEDLRAMAMKAAAAAGIALPAAPPAGGGDGRGLAAAADPGGGGSIFKSVEQLGLKLEPRRSPVEVIVIDHVEKVPTAD